MKQILKRLASGMLACAILALTACGGTADPSGSAPESGGDAAQIAKGRYIEEQIALPEGVGTIRTINQLADGSYRMVANENADNNLGPWKIWGSADNGASWQPVDAPYLAAFEQASISFAYFAPDGRLYASYSIITPEFMEQAINDPESITEYPEEIFAYADPDAVEPTRLDIPLPADENGSGTNAVKVTPDGDLLFGTYFSIHQADAATGEVKNVYEGLGVVAEGNFAIAGEKLLIAGADKVQAYDLATGERLSELSAPKESGVEDSDLNWSRPARVLTAAPDGETFYYCDRGGIYRAFVDGSSVERLADGELLSLGMPSVWARGIFRNADESFLIWAGDDSGENLLLRYRFDAEIPTVPSTELKVYSLEDNKTIRQAIGMFQRRNPDVRVNYQIGLSGGEGIAVSDALRTLSNALLAGDGPDLLVLDGIPVTSYIEKGVLADLSALADPLIADGSLLRNVAETYRQDSGLYAVPARFSTLMLQGDDGAMASVKNFVDMVDWVEKQENRQLECTVPQFLLRQYYPQLAPGWFGQDGTLDTAAFSRDLEALGRLSKIPGAWNERMQYDESYTDDLVFSAIWWKAKMLSLNVGTLNAVKDLAPPDAAIKERGEGGIGLFPSENGPVFMPRTVLGVNAAGKQPELAQDFLRFVLSEEVLSFNFDDGIPVNAAALKKNAENPYSEMDDGMYYSTVTSTTNEEGIETEQVMVEMRVLWPEENFMDGMLAQFAAIETASPVNLVIRQILIDETAPYFTGEMTLDEAVSAFEQKVSLYLAE